MGAHCSTSSSCRKFSVIVRKQRDREGRLGDIHATADGLPGTRADDQFAAIISSDGQVR